MRPAPPRGSPNDPASAASPQGAVRCKPMFGPLATKDLIEKFHAADSTVFQYIEGDRAVLRVFQNHVPFELPLCPGLVRISGVDEMHIRLTFLAAECALREGLEEREILRFLKPSSLNQPTWVVRLPISHDVHLKGPNDPASAAARGRRDVRCKPMFGATRSPLVIASDLRVHREGWHIPTIDGGREL